MSRLAKSKHYQLLKRQLSRYPRKVQIGVLAVGVLMLLAGGIGLLVSQPQPARAATADYWNNSSTDGLWSTAANWSAGVPGATHIATFDVTSVANCAIDTTVNVAGISIAAAYSPGTITQNAGIAITIGSSNFVQAGGTFTAGDAASTITINGTTGNLLYVYGAGAIFNANSSTINITGTTRSYLLYVYSSAVFNAGSSIINLTGTSSFIILRVESGVFNGDTSTVNINSDSSPNNAIYNNATLTFNNLNLAPTITANRTYPTSGAFTVNGDFNINPTAASALRLTVNLGGNVTVAATKTTTITGTNQGLSTLNMTSRTLSSGAVTISSAGTLTITTGTLALTTSGATFFTNNGTFTTTSSSGLTIQSDSAVTLNMFGARDIGNLTFSPTLTADRIYNFDSGNVISVYGNLNITPTAASALRLTVNLAYNMTTIASTKSVIMTPAGSATATLDTTVSNYNLTAGALSINARATFNANGSIITLNGTSVTYLLQVTGTGAIFNTGSSTINLTGTGSIYCLLCVSTPGVFNGDASTVNINSDSSPTYGIYAFGTTTFNNLNLTPTLATTNRTYPITGTITVNGDFNINASSSSAVGLTVNLGTNATVASTKTTTITGSGAGPASSTLNIVSYTLSTGLLTIESPGTLTGTTGNITLTGTNGNPFTNNGTFTAGSTNFYYNGNNLSGNTTIESNATYYKLTTNNGAENFVLEGTTNVTSYLYIVLGTLDTTASSYSLNAGYLIIGNSASSTLIANGSTITLNDASNILFQRGNSGTFTAGSSTVKMNSTASVALTLNSITFWNLTIDNAGQTGTLGAAITVNGNLAINNGTLDTLSRQITGNVSNNLTMAAGTNLILGLTVTATIWPTLFTAGHTSLNATSTVTYNATSPQTVSGVPTYGHLTLGSTGGNKTAGAAVGVVGNFTIGANNTFITSNNALTVGGNLTNSGVFTAGTTGVVTLNGTSQQTVSGTFTNSSSFRNLTLTNASGVDDPGCGTSFTPGVIFSGSATVLTTYTINTAHVRVQYNSGSTYTVANIAWNGQATDTRIYFRNSTLGSGTWLLNVSGTQAVSYVNVARSDASGGSAISADNGTNTNCGSNTNWNWPATNYTPQMNNWRWYADEASTTPTTAYAAENTAPPQEEMGKSIPMKLRSNLTETGGTAENDSRKILQYGTDQVNWTAVGSITDTGVAWRFYDGGGTDGDKIPSKVLSDSHTTSLGTHNEASSGGQTNSDHPASTTVEWEFSIENYNADANTTYYFNLRDEILAADIPLAGGKSYPSLTTAAAYDLSIVGPTSVELGSFQMGSGPYHEHTFSSGESPTIRDNRGQTSGNSSGWSLTADMTTELTTGTYTITKANTYWISDTVTGLYAAPTTNIYTQSGSYMGSAVTAAFVIGNVKDGLGGFTLTTPTMRFYNIPGVGNYSGVILFTLI